MNWKREAVEQLRNYQSNKRALKNMADRIAMINERMKATRTAAVSDEPGGRDGMRQVEDVWLDAITERDNLKIRLSAEQRRVRLVERGLSALTEDERTILTMFYIDRPRDHLTAVCERFKVETATAYRMKDAALRKFVCEEYGEEI